MNKELKEQIHKEFRETISSYEQGDDFNLLSTVRAKYGEVALSEFLEHIENHIDSLIDKTVQQERERIVKNLNKNLFVFKEQTAGGIQDIVLKEQVFQIIEESLITNKSDINK